MLMELIICVPCRGTKLGGNFSLAPECKPPHPCLQLLAQCCQASRHITGGRITRPPPPPANALSRLPACWLAPCPCDGGAALVAPP
jgi:hypothetical protein